MGARMPVPDETAPMLVLELGLRDGGPSVAVVEEAVRRVEEQGVRFSTLVGEGDGNGVRRRLYDLVREGVVEDPSGDGSFVPFEVFESDLYVPYYRRWADLQYIAKRRGEWAGLVNPQLRSPDVMELGISIVRRPSRRMGVARALKLLALQQARLRGVARVRTRNHGANAPILALNRSLGFLEVGA